MCGTWETRGGHCRSYYKVKRELWYLATANGKYHLNRNSLNISDQNSFNPAPPPKKTPDLTILAVT